MYRTRLGCLVRRSHTRARPVPVDELCLPLSPPYSLSTLLPPPSSTTSPLSRETLAKLYRLSALLPPPPLSSLSASPCSLSGLNDLVSIVQTIQTVDTSSLDLQPGEMIDARIRAEPEPITLDSPPIKSQEKEEEEEKGKELGRIDGEILLRGAEKREGRFFVAQMPENVRTRKKNSPSSSSSDREELDLE